MRRRPASVRCVRHLVRCLVRRETRMAIGLCGMCGISPRVCACVGARGCRRVYACAHTRGAHTAHTAHPLHINDLRELAYRTPSPTYRTKKMMDVKKVVPVSVRVIRCTPENAAEFGAAVARWPALHTLAKDLYAKGFILGLRDVQITLSGPPEWVGKGLDAVGVKNGN